MNAVGFAISQAIAQGLWTNPSTSNDAAAAAKLFYDVTVWHTDMPTMDASLADQYNQLMTWYTAALGATAVPVLTTALSAPLPDTPLSITASAVLAFPGTTTAVPNSAVTLSVTDGTFAGGATSVVTITIKIIAENNSSEITPNVLPMDANTKPTSPLGSMPIPTKSLSSFLFAPKPLTNLPITAATIIFTRITGKNRI